jgi:large subunit ribosomal protein L21
MYAIVEIAGQQFKVEKEQEIFVHRLAGEEGSSVEFDQVLLLDNAGKVTLGTPTVNGTLIRAKILEHLRGDKVRVFRKKRRKGYQKENGHRQYFSKLVIEDILTGVKKSEKKAEPQATAVEAKAAPDVETREVKKTASAKKKPDAPKAEKKEAPETKKAVKSKKADSDEEK